MKTIDICTLVHCSIKIQYGFYSRVLHIAHLFAFVITTYIGLQNTSFLIWYICILSLVWIYTYVNVWIHTERYTNKNVLRTRILFQLNIQLNIVKHVPTGHAEEQTMHWQGEVSLLLLLEKRCIGCYISSSAMCGQIFLVFFFFFYWSQHIHLR